MPETLTTQANAVQTAVANFNNYVAQLDYSIPHYRANLPFVADGMGGEIRFVVGEFGGFSFDYELGVELIQDGEVYHAQSFATLSEVLAVALYPMLPGFVTEYTAAIAGAKASAEAAANALLDSQVFDPITTNFIAALQGFNGLLIS